MAPHAVETQHSQNADSVLHQDKSRPLKVIIVGAGVAGLSAAIGLRRAGHEVKIFESSSFTNEVGAAIHICPNATRPLLAWGLDPVKARFDVTRSVLTADGTTLNPLYQIETSHIEETYSAKWYLSHRVDLHNALKDLATQHSGKSIPAKINLRSKVTNIDPEKATITLADSTVHQADLIIAADGVHSSAVSLVTTREAAAVPTGFSAFRFLIPTEDILGDEQTRHIIDGKDGQMKIFVQGPRRLVWYPCRAGTLQNFVAVHPDNEKFGSVEAWNVAASVSDILEEFKTFHPDLVATIQKAKDTNLWKLLYREPLPSWHRQRLLLIGDAAHPMLPHQGQGGAQSIEDGAAIGILLRGLSPDSPSLEADISRRFEGFEAVRRKRASLMQIFSNAGQDEAEKIRGEAERLLGKEEGVKVPTNQGEFHEFNFGHDVFGESERVLASL